MEHRGIGGDDAAEFGPTGQTAHDAGLEGFDGRDARANAAGQRRLGNAEFMTHGAECQPDQFVGLGRIGLSER